MEAILIVLSVILFMVLLWCFHKIALLRSEVEKVNLKDLMIKHDTMSKRYNLIMDYLPVGVEYFDGNGLLTFSNKESKVILTDMDETNYGVVNLFDFANLSDEQRICLKKGGTVTTNFEYCTPLAEKAEIDEVKYLKGIIKAVLDSAGEVVEYIGIIIDQSDAVRDKKRVEASKMELTLSLEAGNLSVWVHDLKTGEFYYIDANDNKQMLMPIEEHLKLKAYSDASVYKGILKKLESGESQKQKMLIHYKDESVAGGYRICESYITPRFVDGHLVRVVGTERDITQTYLHQSKLEEFRRKMYFAIKSANLVQWSYDALTQRFSYVNLNGDMQTVENSIQKCREYIEPRDLKKASVHILQHLLHRTHRELHTELRMKTSKDGDYKYYEIFGMPFNSDDEGRVNSYIGLMNCVDDRLRMTERLKKLNHQNNLVLNNTNSALIYITTDYQVQWENVSTYYGDNLFDGACSYKSGTKCYEGIGLDKPCEHCMFRQAVESREISSVEFVLHDGKTIEVSLVPVISSSNEVEGAVFRIDDISERKRFIRELEAQRIKAEAANKLKSAFLANMSHEIRTPLNAIVGFAGLMQDQLTAEERIEYGKVISSNSEQLLTIISDILDLSKIEAGYLEFNIASFDIHDLFTELSLNWSRHMPQGVVFQCENPLSSCMVEFDVQRLRQVITNYMSNAVKFTKSGSIVLGYERIDNQQLRIYVKDTGCGIAKENHKKVFTRFEKLNNYAQGTGLGLSICKAIIESQGGKVGFESEYGQGSCFWAIIPMVLKPKS